MATNSFAQGNNNYLRALLFCPVRKVRLSVLVLVLALALVLVLALALVLFPIDCSMPETQKVPRAMACVRNAGG